MGIAGADHIQGADGVVQVIEQSKLQIAAGKARQSVTADRFDGIKGTMFDYILGLRLFGERIVIVGWIALFEWILVILVDKLCATDISGTNHNVANTFSIP